MRFLYFAYIFTLEVLSFFNNIKQISGGSVYAFLENSDIANVDVLDTTTNTWTSAEPLPQSRSASGCAVYELNGNPNIFM